MEIMLTGLKFKLGETATLRWKPLSNGKAPYDDGATYIVAGVMHARYDGRTVLYLRYLPTSEYPTLEFGRTLDDLLTACKPDRVCQCGKCDWLNTAI